MDEDDRPRVQRQIHFPIGAPKKIGAAASWSTAFALAQELLKTRPLTTIAIDLKQRYTGDRVGMPLTDKGTPEQTLAWMSEFTPLVHHDVHGIELYVSDGQMMSPSGPKESCQLDFVIEYPQPAEA